MIQVRYDDDISWHLTNARGHFDSLGSFFVEIMIFTDLLQFCVQQSLQTSKTKKIHLELFLKLTEGDVFD